MPVDFSGNWEYTRAENMLEFMQKFDPATAERMKAYAGSPPRMSMEVEQTGDCIKSKMVRDDRSTEIVFTVGQPAEHDLPNGKKIKGTAVWDGGKLVMSAEDEQGAKLEMTREVIGDEQILTLTAHGITAKRYYKKV